MNFKNIAIYVQCLYFLTLSEFRVRYKNSFFGYVWALLNPLAFASVYYLAFKLIMRFDIPDYGLILMTAMFPWVWLSNSLVKGTSSIVVNSHMVKKMPFNFSVLPLSMVSHDLMHFLLSLPVIFLFIILSGYDLYWSWIWQIPVLVFYQFTIIASIVLFTSALNVFVRDIEYIISVSVSLLFFLTPIVYPISVVPEQYLFIYNVNPFIDLISSWRSIFLNGELNLLITLIRLICWMIIFIIGFNFFNRKRYNFASIL